MKLKRVWKNIIISLVLIASIPLVLFLLVRFTPQPPEYKMELAREALSKAESINALKYSEKLYKEARALYDSAMANWQKENQRFIYSRNYDKVEHFAVMSANKAEAAMRSSQDNASDLNIKLRNNIDTLNSLVADINKLFASWPLSGEVRNQISRGKLLLKESEVAYKKGDYLTSEQRIKESGLLIESSYEIAVNNLKDYFNSFPVWKKWIDRTIRESRQNQTYSIIIDKYSRKCLVYLAGVKKYEYHVELGKNWVGDKRVNGDKATPEGMYKVVRKFGSNKTKYHKALLIDYPNQTDREEFRREVLKGTLPKTANIGSLIEIHGDGGRGVDWTEGCIALTNPEMDIVFKIAREGTPVTIVGSMVSLDQILN